MKTILPNYNECITSVSNSILKHFNLETYHNSLTDLDKILEKNYKNVIVILCDGMGSLILDEKLDKDSFLIKNRLKTITTVYPPTTTAATTSMLSGLNPNEHGWLGWDLYFEKENQTITMFLNTLKDSNVIAQNYNVAKTTFPYESIIDKIDKKSCAYGIFPFGSNPYINLDDMLKRIVDLSKTEDKKFIYAYYEDPDHKLHDYGINSDIVTDEIKTIDKKLEELCEKLKDSVVIVLADHGHIDVEYYNLDNYKNIKDMLERTTSIEPRAISFKVKQGKINIFKEEFNKTFGKYFILYSNEEIKENKIFGVGENNKHFDSEISDYIAVATSNKCIVYDSLSQNFKSTHAGLTEKEMLIPIVVKEIKK